jgi:putative redox protein
MSAITVHYEGGDRFDVAIRQHHLRVDLPPNLSGTDTGPSAAELFVASLVASMANFAQRFLKHREIDPSGLEVSAAYTVSLEWPMRVEWIDIELTVPPGTPSDLIEPLRKVIERSTVSNSMSEPPKVTLTLSEKEAA